MLGSQFWSVISDPWALVTALWAITLGIIMGALPGLTGPMAMALLLGVVYTMTKEYAIVAMMLIYMGGVYGGSLTARPGGRHRSPGDPTRTTTGGKRTCRPEPRRSSWPRPSR
jgi:TctA family transporter